MSDAVSTAPAAARERFPPQVKFLAWNEGCERFSYYGMTSILTLHMVRNLGLAENSAVAGYQLFVFAVYFTPLVGAWLADRVLGRYRVILWLSFGYVLGHATLAVFESAWGLTAGLALIAIGAGGIKPCASAFLGDQLPANNPTLVQRAYNLYYWMINFGSMASTLSIPWLLANYGPSVAFAVPGILMALALVLFVAGRKHYVYVPPTRGKQAWTPEAKRALFRISMVFLPVAAFWALFFQYGSAWILQAERMNRVVLGVEVLSAQVTTLNAVFVLSLIPLFAGLLYPALEKAGIRVTPLRKMTVGMFVSVLSFASAAAIQLAIDRGGQPHVGWQVFQYLFISMGEVLVSVTALEFAYTQAPIEMKSTIMSIWYVTIAAGSLLTAAVAALNQFEGTAYYLFFTALMLAAAVVFTFVARWYRPAVPEAARP